MFVWAIFSFFDAIHRNAVHHLRLAAARAGPPLLPLIRVAVSIAAGPLGKRVLVVQGYGRHPTFHTCFGMRMLIFLHSSLQPNASGVAQDKQRPAGSPAGCLILMSLVSI